MPQQELGNLPGRCRPHHNPATERPSPSQLAVSTANKQLFLQQTMPVPQKTLGNLLGYVLKGDDSSERPFASIRFASVRLASTRYASISVASICRRSSQTVLVGSGSSRHGRQAWAASWTVRYVADNPSLYGTARACSVASILPPPPHPLSLSVAQHGWGPADPAPRRHLLPQGAPILLVLP